MIGKNCQLRRKNAAQRNKGKKTKKKRKRQISWNRTWKDPSLTNAKTSVDHAVRTLCTCMRVYNVCTLRQFLDVITSHPSYLDNVRWNHGNGGFHRSQNAAGASSCCWRSGRGHYCLTTWNKDGKNICRKYQKAHPHTYTVKPFRMPFFFS